MIERLLMKREYRYVAELRAEGQGDEIALAGYAALFNSESKDLGGFRETVAPGAFTRSLKEGADVKALVNHDPSQLLGRSKNGTLTLSQDDRGLKFRVVLNPKSQAHRDLHASVERGDMDECSFAFTVDKDGQTWTKKPDTNGSEDFYAARTLLDVDLMDVSVVTYPAYNNTSVTARSLFPDGELPEIRSAIKSLNVMVPEQRDDDCYEELICEVADALAEKYPAKGYESTNIGMGRYCVVETYPNYVIAYDYDSGDYVRITYHEDEVEESFLFGEPEPVEKQWMPSERSKKLGAEYRVKLQQLAEEHKKAAAAASAQAAAHTEAAGLIEQSIEEKKAYRLKNGLLDDEDWEDDVMVDPTDVENDDERAQFLNAEKRADGKVRTKKVGGKNLTQSNFAYVGDPDKTETWKLPIHDAAHVRNALSRFNQTEGIPAKEKGKVWNKILAAAKKFDIKVSELENSRALATCPFTEEEVLERRLQLAAILY